MNWSKRITPPQTPLNIIAFLLWAFLIACILAPILSPPGHYPDRRSMAKSDVIQIATAVNAFVTEYGVLPSTNRGTVGGAFLATLMGRNHLLNPRDLVFLEVGPVKRGYSGVTNGIFVDPWGGPYQIAFDGDYDNYITNAGTNAATGVRKIIAVWSDPNLDPDASSLSEAKKARRYLTSWD